MGKSAKRVGPLLCVISTVALAMACGGSPTYAPSSTQTPAATAPTSEGPTPLVMVEPDPGSQPPANALRCDEPLEGHVPRTPPARSKLVVQRSQPQLVSGGPMTREAFDAIQRSEPSYDRCEPALGTSELGTYDFEVMFAAGGGSVAVMPPPDRADTPFTRCMMAQTCRLQSGAIQSPMTVLASVWVQHRGPDNPPPPPVPQVRPPTVSVAFEGKNQRAYVLTAPRLRAWVTSAGSQCARQVPPPIGGGAVELVVTIEGGRRRARVAEVRSREARGRPTVNLGLVRCIVQRVYTHRPSPPRGVSRARAIVVVDWVNFPRT